MATHEDIVDWVDRNVNSPTTYGRVADALGTSARAVGGAMRDSPEWFQKAHLVLRSDWTVNPGFEGGKAIGAREAAARLEADGFPVVESDGVYRLANLPED